MQNIHEFVSKMSEYFARSNHALFSELALDLSKFEPPEIEFTIPFNGSFSTSSHSGTYPLGVYSIFLDSVLGIGSLVATGTRVPVATLSLTVENIAANQLGESLRAVGRTDALINDIAYASGALYGASTGQLLARASGAFAINTKGPGFGEHMIGTINSECSS